MNVTRRIDALLSSNQWLSYAISSSIETVSEDFDLFLFIDYKNYSS